MQPLSNDGYICKMQSTKNKIDFETSIAPWLGKTAKIVDYYIHEALCEKDLNLTKEQMIVLKKLHDRDGLPQNELAFLTLRDKSSLTRLLVKMEKKEYIIRKQSITDKRINNVFLTDLGKEIFKKTRPIIKNIIDTMEQNISVVDKQQMIKLLQKIQFNFTSENASL
jgi:DNA-binding MarR family transcriptional regulator